MNASYSDSILVSNYINGNEKALEILVTRHKTRLYNFIYSKVYNVDLSEDLFQDTFIKVIKNLKKGNYNEEGKFLPWLMRIAHNLVIDHFRKSNRMPKFESKDKDFDIFTMIKDSSYNVEKQIITDQISSDVRMLLDKLPDDQKQVVYMRLFKDMSFKEIAENTNVSINTSLGRMRYAIINLRRLIEKHNIILTE
jgi:RNA polymerase sigma-70 factor (ECF subfamily)